LADGRDNGRGTADTPGIASDTARVQFTSVFAMTVVRTQPALARLLCRVGE
jgi:hypothetical protein